MTKVMCEKNTFKKIRKVLEFVWTSPYSSFYRDKYKKAGIDLLKDVNSMEDFRKLPYLTKEEIISADPYDRFFLPKDKIKSWRITSGTSGGDMGIFFRADKEIPSLSQKALSLGVKTCLIIHSPQGLMVRAPHIRHKKIKAFYANLFDLPLTVKLMLKLKPQALSVSTSTLSRLIPLLESDGCSLKNIKYIVLEGEYCSFARLSYFKEKFPNAYFRLAFSSSEAGGIGYKCDFLYQNSSQVFHPFSHLYLEFADSKKEELILSHTKIPREFPLIRYKTGDVVKLIKEKCPCGKNIKIKVFGRLNLDVIKVKGVYVYPQIIDEAICSMRNYLDISSWRVHIFDGKRTKLKFILLPKKGLRDTKNILVLVKRKLMQDIYFDSKDSLENLIKKRIFDPIDVKFVKSIQVTPPKSNYIIKGK